MNIWINYQNIESITPWSTKRKIIYWNNRFGINITADNINYLFRVRKIRKVSTREYNNYVLGQYSRFKRPIIVFYTMESMFG